MRFKTPTFIDAPTFRTDTHRLSRSLGCVSYHTGSRPTEITYDTVQCKFCSVYHGELPSFHHQTTSKRRRSTQQPANNGEASYCSWAYNSPERLGFKNQMKGRETRQEGRRVKSEVVAGRHLLSPEELDSLAAGHVLHSSPTTTQRSVCSRMSPTYNQQQGRFRQGSGLQREINRIPQGL